MKLLALILTLPVCLFCFMFWVPFALSFKLLAKLANYCGYRSPIHPEVFTWTLGTTSAVSFVGGLDSILRGEE